MKATRRTPALKHYLRRRAQEYQSLKTYTGEAYDPLAIEQPPPLPLPEDIWGESWQFAAITPADLEQLMQYPLRILAFDMAMLPEALGLTSDVLIPGIILYGGRKSLKLAAGSKSRCPIAWICAGQPAGWCCTVACAIAGSFLTFDNAEIAKAGELFRDRLRSTQGLHFFLIQPTPNDTTYTALWLLQPLE